MRMSIKRYICAAFALTFCMLLYACAAKRSTARERTVYAMDTVMTMKAYGRGADAALDAAEDEINRLDKLLRRKGGGVGTLNQNGGGKADEDILYITKRSKELSAETGGAFDITIAPVMDLWGFYEKDFRVPDAAELSRALGSVGYGNIDINGDGIVLRNGAQIDLGAVAKGYLSGRIIRIFRERGVKAGIVSLGGNVQALGEKPDGGSWNVAIQFPGGGAQEYAGIVETRGEAVITSGGYQRFFERNGVVYHHIIDPVTGSPARSGLSSVSVISEDPVMADALSTALFVMGTERAAEYWRTHDGFELVLITDDGGILITEGLEGRFTCTQGRAAETVRR